MSPTVVSLTMARAGTSCTAYCFDRETLSRVEGNAKEEIILKHTLSLSGSFK